MYKVDTRAFSIKCDMCLKWMQQFCPQAMSKVDNYKVDYIQQKG